MTKKGGASYTTTQALQNYKPPPAEKPEDDQSDKRIEDLEEIHLQLNLPHALSSYEQEEEYKFELLFFLKLSLIIFSFQLQSVEKLLLLH